MLHRRGAPIAVDCLWPHATAVLEMVSASCRVTQPQIQHMVLRPEVLFFFAFLKSAYASPFVQPVWVNCNEHWPFAAMWPCPCQLSLNLLVHSSFLLHPTARQPTDRMACGNVRSVTDPRHGCAHAHARSLIRGGCAHEPTNSSEQLRQVWPILRLVNACAVDAQTRRARKSMAQYNVKRTYRDSPNDDGHTGTRWLTW